MSEVLTIPKIEMFNDILTNVDFKKNEINLILGKNNLGKTNILNFIHSYYEPKKNKPAKIKSYFLDLNVNPFNDIVKSQDISLAKEKINSSYLLIKEEFDKIIGKVNKEKINDLIVKEMKINELKEKINAELNINKLGITLSINTKQIDDFFKKPFLYKGKSRNNEEHDIETVGLGHLRILMIKMLNIIISNSEDNNEFLLLIDEPEAFLHPNLIKEVTSLLKTLCKIENKIVTIIISSHSTYVVSELKDFFLNVRLLELKNNELNFSNIINKDEIIAKYKNNLCIYFEQLDNKSDDFYFNILKSMFSFDFNRLFFSDKIICVEGISDYYALTFSYLNIYLKEKLEDYEIISFHGLENFPKVYTILKQFHKNFIFLLDHDKNDEGSDSKNYTNLNNFKTKKKLIIFYFSKKN